MNISVVWLISHLPKAFDCSRDVSSEDGCVRSLDIIVKLFCFFKEIPCEVFMLICHKVEVPS